MLGVPFAGTLPAPRAINSSKTRDCKVKMLQTMTEQEIDSFEDYLADVLCVDYLQRPATSVSGATAMPVSHAAAPVFS